MNAILASFRRNRTFWITLFALILFFVIAIRGMVDTDAEGGRTL